MSADCIASCTKQCRVRFQDCLEASNAKHEWLTNRLADFDLWADGIGAALENHHGSLDYRLRDRSDIRDIVLRLIETLRDTLKQYVDECTSAWEAVTTGSQRPRPDCSDEPTGNSGAGTKSSAPSTPFSEISTRINRIMDQLNRLSMAIRRSGNVIRYEKADRSLKLEEYAEFINTLHFLLARKIKGHNEEEKTAVLRSGLLPDPKQLTKTITIEEVLQLRQMLTDPVLLSIQDRLIRINVKRRNRIFCARDRSERMTSQYSNQARSLIHTQTQDASAPGGLRLPHDNSLERGNEPHNKQPKEQSTRTLVASSATGLGSQLARPPQPPNSAAPTKTTTTGADIGFPRPPHRQHDASLFQCPYCYITLDKKYSEKRRWRSHVKEDLQPYNCIYDRCPNADESYGTSSAWKNHMELVHAEKVWNCFLCGLDQPRSFSTGEALKEHLQRFHGSENVFTESQLPMIVEKSRESQPLVIERCPICMRKNEAFSDMFAHVKEELLEFALEALPWGGTFRGPSARSQSHSSFSNNPAKDRAYQDDSDLSGFEGSNLSLGGTTRFRDTFGSGAERSPKELASFLKSSTLDDDFILQEYLGSSVSQEEAKIEDQSTSAASSAIEDFWNWANSSLAQRPGFRASDDKTELYVADSELQSFFNETGRLSQLLQVVSPAFRSHTLDIDKVRQHYLKVFAILLLAGKGHLIDLFVDHPDVQDYNLPIRIFPKIPGESTKNLSRLFEKHQWRFFVRKLTYGMEATLFEDEILPIKHKVELGRGGDAVTFEIEVEEEYNDLESDESRQGVVEAYRQDHNLFVLKTYRNRADIYQNELTAFQLLKKNAKSHSDIVNMLGSFVQGNRMSMLFGYCDLGTLDDYMAQTARPTGKVRVRAFWNEFFGLAQGLAYIHDVVDEDPVHGWHQDIKPANILVFSTAEEDYPDCRFKIADLGVSHFKKAEPSQVDILDRDSHGTYAYGAPETYRSDSEVGLKQLLVSRAVDIWSFGCVCSEVAVWIMYGWDRVLQYRDQRRLEARKRLGILAGDLFHDGNDSALQVVGAFHEQLQEDSQASNNFTGEVVRRLILPMLQKPLLRPTAIDIYDLSKQLVRESIRESLPSGDEHGNLGSVESQANSPDHKGGPRTSIEERKKEMKFSLAEKPTPTEESSKEDYDKCIWLYDDIAQYQLTAEIINDYLSRIFIDYDDFFTERHGDYFRFWVPRKLTRAEQNRLLMERVPRSDFS